MLLELPFLLTKITVPPLRERGIARSLLIERLSTNVPLVLLSASPGFGKTTLLSAWARQTHSHVAWLMLDEQDNDPAQFWLGVLAALRHNNPGFGEAAFASLTATLASPLQRVLAALLNDLARRAEETTLILDDYQVIDEPSIHQSLAFVLAHTPACLRLLLSSRVDPPLPLSRLRARAQLVEVRDADLRLSAEEAADFLTQTMELRLPEEAALQLWQRTEGWITGLQLAALSLRLYADPTSFVQAFSGGHRYLLDYVRDEVLAHLPLDTQRFLLRTSVLTALCADLCATLSGEQASQQMLEQLERANLFVAPLDDERRWYRYHPLFRDVLLARLRAVEPEQVPRLHRAASAWYAGQQRDAEAIAHALEAEDWEAAARLLERLVSPQSWRNEYHLLRRSLACLPVEVLRTHPHLALLLAQAIVFTTQSGPHVLSQVEEPLGLALQGYRDASDLAGEGSVYVARAVLLGHRGAFAIAFALARQALPLLPAGEQTWRGLCLVELATEAVLAGQFDQADSLLMDAHALLLESEQLTTIQFTRLLRGDMALCRGDLERAHFWFQQVLSSVNEWHELVQFQLTDGEGERRAHFERLGCYGMAAVAFERNDLSEAQHYLQEAGDVDQLSWLHVLTPGVLLWVRLLYAQGESERARARLLELEASVRQPDVQREVHLCQAWLALTQGDVEAARAFAAKLAPDGAPLALVRREEETWLRARLRIAEGQEERTLAELAPLLQETRNAGRLHQVVQILVLQARGQVAGGNDLQARATLLQAVTVASKAGYRRLFLEEGPLMKTLLQHLLPDVQEPGLAAFVRHLLLAFGPPLDPALASAGEEPPVPREPLTAQEQRVLGLLAEGASNQMIARALVVEVSTAKKHVSRILWKLGVQNRTQAIARARKDGLL